MRITIKEIEAVIESISGKRGVSVFKVLKNKKDVNEFDIAEKLDLTINEIRNILYKFDHYNLVGFYRKKDRKKGWYIYFWTFDMDRAKKVVLKLRYEELEKLKKRLKSEQGQFYYCPNRCVRLNATNSLEQDYRCDECGGSLLLEGDKKVSNRLKREIARLEKYLGLDKS